MVIQQHIDQHRQEIDDTVHHRRGKAIAHAEDRKCRCAEEEKELQHGDGEKHTGYRHVGSDKQGADQTEQAVGNDGEEKTCCGVGQKPSFPAHRQGVEGVAHPAV